MMRSALRERFSKEWFAKEGVCASVLGVDGAVNWLLKQKECNDDDDRRRQRVNTQKRTRKWERRKLLPKT